MSVVSMSEIVGIRHDDTITCRDCFDRWAEAEAKEDRDVWGPLLEEQLITEEEVDNSDSLWFCDECGKQLV